MCGIVGYVGPRQSQAILLSGLARLEYRGYDSAGIAVIDGDGDLGMRKKAGKLKVLRDDLTSEPLPDGTTGIGHTRWATHGGPTDGNAHPHLADDDKLAVIHNGIIENFGELKDELLADGFLYPNAELERRGLMDRKGFPESYDRRALVSFLTEVKSGAAEVRAPYYSHMRYDIVPDAAITVRRPDIVIVEGLNVLQPPPTPNDVAVSDLFDFSIYVDADAEHIAEWYVDRFLALRRAAFSNPNSFFNVFADLTDEEAVERAMGFWNAINLPNLEENVLPTRHRASLVLQKAADHTVERVLLRKL